MVRLLGCDAMLDVLASPVPRLAANVSAYGLSVPLAMESGSLVTLLKRILTPVSSAEHGSYSDGQVIAAPTLLRRYSMLGTLEQLAVPSISLDDQQLLERVQVAGSRLCVLYHST